MIAYGGDSSCEFSVSDHGELARGSHLFPDHGASLVGRHVLAIHERAELPVGAVLLVESKRLGTLFVAGDR